MLDSSDTASDPRVNGEACERLGIRSLAIAPVHSVSGVIGVVEAFAAEPGWFDRGALDCLARAAEHLSFLHHYGERAVSPKKASDNACEKPSRLLLHFSKAESDPGDNFGNEIHRNTQAERKVTPALPTFLHVARLREQLWPIAGLLLLVAIAVLPASWMITRSSTHTANVGASRALATGNGLPNPVNSANILSSQELVSEATAPVRIMMAKALAGNTDAQASLADHYARGDGVRKDAVKAAVWYIVAGSHGNERATKSAVEISRNLQPFEIAQVRFNLGTMFRDGIGTSPDLRTAYLWFSLADLAGDVRAPGAQRNLEQVMTASDIAQARRRTTQWMHSHRQRGEMKGLLASNRNR